MTLKLWFLLRDVLVTGTGLGVIISQVFSQHPSGVLLGTGLALTVPSVAAHLKALLPSGGEGSPSPLSLPGGSSASGPPSGVPGE